MMENINFIKIFFAQCAIIMVLVSCLLNTMEKFVPVFVARTFRYGKFASQTTSKTFIKPIELPKSWFKHFYVFASIASSFAMFLLTHVYVFKNPVPEWFLHMLNKLGGVQRYSTVTATATYLGLLLFTLQCFRRFYDTHFVSVFGKNGRINLTHYVVGFFHYFGVILSILVEAPKFTIHNVQSTDINLADISYTEIFATLLFLWAWWNQHKATKIFANLRKNINGKVVSNGHHLPEGGLFEYISSPHYSSEILMYMSLYIILWNNSTWWYVLIWVLSNQIETALLSHWWYQENFPNYPKDRKALIPYIF